MSLLTWQVQRNLENSFVDFLQSEISTSNLTVLDNEGNLKTPQIRVGFEADGSWELPVISFYLDSRVSPRLSLGSNKRQKSYLLVIDIRALDIGMQQDLTDWVEETINDGFPYYEYSPSGDPENPTKVQTGYISLAFISSVPVRLGENVDIFEKFRHNITIEIVIEG